MQEITLSGVATKQGISEVRIEIQEVRSEIQGVKIELQNEIQSVRNDIQNVKNEMFKFQMIQTIAIIGVMIALSQFS